MKVKSRIKLKIDFKLWKNLQNKKFQLFLIKIIKKLLIYLLQTNLLLKNLFKNFNKSLKSI